MTLYNAPNADSPVAGQAKIASTGTAVQLGTGTLTNGAIITAKASNSGDILLGSSAVTNTEDGTGNGYILAAGASVSAAQLNVKQCWANGTSGDIVSWFGS